MPSINPEKLKTMPRHVNEQFALLWDYLFTTPVHLDSALSKLPKTIKPILAQIVPAILQRPSSLAHYYKFRLQPGEPFSYTMDQKAQWHTASVLCDRIYKSLRQDPYFLDGAHVFVEDFPQEMNRVWRDQVGPAGAKLLGSLLARSAPLSLRVSRKFSRSDLIDELKADPLIRASKVTISESKISPNGLVINGYAPVMHTPSFKKGAYEIQDEGSQVMGYFALWPKIFLPLLTKLPGKYAQVKGKITLPEECPPWTVIDACAGAGGKTLAMSDAMKGRGQIFSYDISEKKLLSLRQRAKRSGWNNVKSAFVKEGEEEKVVSKFRKRADVVLVDAPCSGWGVLRRNPDIKWRQSLGSLDRMAPLQMKLLETYADLVKKDGRLVYGVCTFRQEETVDLVNEFLDRNPHFSPIGGGYLGPTQTADGFFMYAFTRQK